MLDLQWSLGNATGDQRSQIRAEVTAMERQLSELSVSTLKTYGKVPLVTKEPAIKLLPEAEKMSEIRRMYAEQPADRQLYAKGLPSMVLVVFSAFAVTFTSI